MKIKNMANENENYAKLAQKIKLMRKEKGYSQTKFSIMLGISREHLAKLETAKRCPSIGLLFDMAKLLNVETKDFFDFKNI